MSLIPVEAIDSAMALYREAVVPVTSDVVSAPDHLSAAVIRLPGALKFLDVLQFPYAVGPQVPPPPAA